MVYIYKKAIGKKDYYYLRASSKIGKNAITKDIAYLGGSIKEAKTAISSLKGHETEIRKAYRKINLFLESNHYLEIAKKNKYKQDLLLEDKIYEIEACKIHYDKDFKKQNKLTQKQLMDNFVVDFTYNTTSIEGNTIELKDVGNFLREGITPKNKTLRELYDLHNTRKVFESMDFEKELNNKFIVKIHSGLMENIDERTGYRIKDVHVKDSHFSSSPWQYVNADMNELLKWYSENSNKLHPFVLATIFHHMFEKIHPFFDGNGRTGRILMNFILMKSAYPPIIIRKKYRTEYLSALGKADKKNLFSNELNHYKAIVQFNANEFVLNYWNNFL